jgi:alkylation response protein AidB-like acyl-CoA dehydrogenase
MGINAFIVEKVGLVLILVQKKRKWNSAVVIHSLHVYRCKEENRIGEDGFGFAFAMNVLNGGRIGIASRH